MTDIDSLFEFLKHGDEEHQAWLKEAIYNFFTGKPRPEVRGGSRKDAVLAQIKELVKEY